jgi:ABC-type bacteriocin/lantibiotic exporter with double-glycine peptidase domain
MRKLFLIISLLSLSACNTLTGIKVPENIAEQVPPSFQNKVPLIAQNDGYSCATTSLAMVMSFHDKKKYDKSEVWDKSGSSIYDVKNVCGNDMGGLKNAAKWAGFEHYEFKQSSSPDELRYLVSNGLPVIINIRNFTRPSYHAVVVTGYKDGEFVINDPAGWGGESYTVSEKKLEHHWYANLCSPRAKEVSRSIFVVYPKGWKPPLT